MVVSHSADNHRLQYAEGGGLTEQFSPVFLCNGALFWAAIAVSLVIGENATLQRLYTLFLHCRIDSCDGGIAFGIGFQAKLVHHLLAHHLGNIGGAEF